MTSKAIKRAQFKPAEAARISPDSWAVKSNRTDERYAVTRQRLKVDSELLIRWKCGCRATTPACRHIVSVISRELREKGWVAAFWTTRQEAKRQRRKVWAMESNGASFWVTGRPAPDVRRPHERGRFLGVETDVFGHRDAHWIVQGWPGRYAMVE